MIREFAAKRRSCQRPREAGESPASLDEQAGSADHGCSKEVLTRVTLPFDQKNLAKDVLLAISEAIDGKRFRGHDDRDYSIVRDVSHISEPQRFIDVVVATGDAHSSEVATYGIVLIAISRTK